MSISRRTAIVSAAAVLAAPALPVISAHAAAPKVGKQVAGFYRFNVGDFEVTALHDGATPYEVNATRFPNAPVEDVIKLMDQQFIPSKPGISPFNTVIVNTGSKLILIDAGFANNGAPTTGQMAANMAAAGISPAQIDTVLISHFHPDHINGSWSIPMPRSSCRQRTSRITSTRPR
jgi:Metallo-beta-lactamase superfamily